MRAVMLAAVAILVVAAIAAFVLLRSRPSSADPEPPARSPADTMRELRERLLRGSAAQFSIEPAGAVWGVLMEMGHADAAVTPVALNDGTASLYFSWGGGVIGGGPHPSINASARRTVAMAACELSKLSPTAAFPLPAVGEVKFYVLTTGGVLTAAAREETLGAGEHPLSALFYAGHDVITALREVTEERGR
jgi:hypothetical protein